MLLRSVSPSDNLNLKWKQYDFEFRIDNDGKIENLQKIRMLGL